MRFSSSKKPSPFRHVLRQWHRSSWPVKEPVSPSQIPSQHILCAGPYTVPFARLAAEAALASCPEAWRGELKLHIHVDSVHRSLRDKVLAWLAEVPGVSVSYGLFGIPVGDIIPGKWHQAMINRVVEHFAGEAHLGFIDADLFIDGPAWWEAVRGELSADTYALSVGMRDTRTLVLDGRSFSAMKTNLFTLNTVLHARFNRQRFNKDIAAIEESAKMIPGARFDVGRGLDTMVQASLVAQASGYSLLDLDGRIPHCHVGGFSHIKPEKFMDKGNLSQEVIDTWLCRVRLINRVIGHMRERDWLGYLDPGHLAIVAATSAVVGARSDLLARQEELPLTAHEMAFGNVLAALSNFQ